MNTEMKPLRIDFTFEKPISAPRHSIHLDGVLAWSAVQEGIEEGIDMDIAQEMLPLAQHGDGQDAVWKASWIEFGPGERDSMSIIRSFRVPDVVADNGRSFHEVRKQDWASEKSSSPYKAYLIQVPLRHVRTASAWCVGNPEEVKRLLARVTHLGKLSRIDLGRIREKIVVEDPAAHLKWKWRTLPWDEPGYAKSFETVRAPYWKKQKRREAWIPLCSSSGIAGVHSH